MNRLIRPAVSADFPILVAIDQSCFEASVAYTASELKYFMSRRHAATLVAEADGTIAGFLLLNIEKSRSQAVLVTLDVVETHRNAGIGSDLFACSERLLAANKVPRYQLQVDPSNRVAFFFYKRRGFHVVRTLRNYYRNGADAYLMEKRLGEVATDA